jgi:hypothetical protein
MESSRRKQWPSVRVWVSEASIVVYKLKYEIIIYKYSLGCSLICLEGRVIKTS